MLLLLAPPSLPLLDPQRAYARVHRIAYLFATLLLLTGSTAPYIHQCAIPAVAEYRHFPARRRPGTFLYEPCAVRPDYRDLRLHHPAGHQVTYRDGATIAGYHLADLSVGLAILRATADHLRQRRVPGRSRKVHIRFRRRQPQSVLHALPTTGQDEIKAWLQEPIPGGADTGPLDLRFTDGRFYQVHAQRLESGQIAVLFHDISRLKSYQSQAIQASKLALLGELSTSVAHEINQPCQPSSSPATTSSVISKAAKKG